MSINNIRSCTWCLVLYPQEDITHKKALDFIKLNYSHYAYIEHNQDLDSDNNFIKPHTHIVIKFKNYRWRNSIALELGITPNYLEKCFNLDKALLYLIHFEDYEKKQYNIDEVVGTSLKKRLENLIKTTELDENDSIISIIDYINNYPTHLSMSSFVKYIATTPLLHLYKKYYFCINQCIKEHNIDISLGKVHKQ